MAKAKGKRKVVDLNGKTWSSRQEPCLLGALLWQRESQKSSARANSPISVAAERYHCSCDKCPSPCSVL
jgi:hypothetical protein